MFHTALRYVLLMQCKGKKNNEKIYHLLQKILISYTVFSSCKYVFDSIIQHELYRCSRKTLFVVTFFIF